MDKHLIQSAPSSMYYIPDFISAEEEASIIDKVCHTGGLLYLAVTQHFRRGANIESNIAVEDRKIGFNDLTTNERSLTQIPSNRWITLSHRRLQAVPARLTATNTLLAATPLPEWLLRPMTDRFHDLGIFEGAPHGVNHCLINEYLPGQGIMPHEDGGAYHPVVATVSLGGTIVLDVTAKSPSNAGDASLMRWRILQEPRSLLVTTAAAYTETLHGIAEVHEDVDLRPETVANWDLLGDREAINAKGNMNERTTRISLTYRNVLKVSSLGNKLFGRTK